MYDHWRIAQTVNAQLPRVLNMGEVKGFTDQAAEIIGEGSWKVGELGWPFDGWTQYALAEHRYAREGEADFVVTRLDIEGELVWEYDGFKLFRVGK